MTENLIYETIAKRTDGNIYIGVVGPVRTGKSTFIHKILEKTVIPNISNDNDRQRTIDEIPQSASGRSITTTEPKFIPNEAVSVKLSDTEIRMRLIDCVGYPVEGAIGGFEDGEERLVMTPWCETAIPFTKAAEIGTQKVLLEHSTIAILVTSDGSICDLPRESYIPAEERTVKELREARKPFAIVLNSAHPEAADTVRLAEELEKKYSSPVALVNCATLNDADIEGILSLVVGEFPITELRFRLPDWYSILPEDDALCHSVMSSLKDFASSVSKLSDIDPYSKQYGYILSSLDAASGSGVIEIPISKDSFLSALSKASGLELGSDAELFSTILELAEAKRDYDKIKRALCDARERGYGIVMPTERDMRISEPKLIKQGSSYGICVSASADTIHMIRADIKADVCPVIGTEEQSEEVIKLMLDDYAENPEGLLSTKMLGRSLYDLVNDGMNAKLTHISDESRQKLGRTLEKIVNDGASGLICILV